MLDARAVEFSHTRLFVTNQPTKDPGAIVARDTIVSVDDLRCAVWGRHELKLAGCGGDHGEGVSNPAEGEADGCKRKFFEELEANKGGDRSLNDIAADKKEK